MLPPEPPVKAGWKGREGESGGAETTGGKEEERQAELKVPSGERWGKGSAMPTLGERVEGTAVVSISRLQLTQSLGPSHTVSTQHFCLGWLPSPPLPLLPHRQLLLLASSSFLALTGQKKGTGSSCLAQQPPQPCGLQRLLGG